MQASDLAKWYADPLTPAQAQQRLDALRNEIRRAQTGQIALRIEEMIARYWLGRDISGDIDNLQATCQHEICMALVRLVYGQLLMSRKLSGAMDCLQQAFKQASKLLPAADYLDVMRRHDTLKHLVLKPQPSPPQPLHDLLNEAAIVKKLKGKQDHHCDVRSDRKDTVG